MIWIKNHGIRGESDNLRIPLESEVEAVKSHKNDPKASPAIVRMQGWTGVGIDSDVSDVREQFKEALGDQLLFAVDGAADNDDYNSKDEELDAYYAGEHPDT